MDKNFTDKLFMKACCIKGRQKYKYIAQLALLIECNGFDVATPLITLKIPPIVFAIKSKCLPVIEILLESDADDEYALVAGVKTQNLEIVKSLIKHRGGVDIPYGEPLRQAIWIGHLELVHLLIKSGADPTCNKALPMHMAFRMIFRGPSVTRKKILLMVLERVKELCEVKEEKSKEKMLGKFSTACLAIFGNNPTILAQMLEDEDWSSFHEFPGLREPHITLEKLGARFGNYKAVRAFVKSDKINRIKFCKAVMKGGDLKEVKACNTWCGFQKYEFLHIACSYNNFPIIKYLIDECGFSLDDRDIEGDCPLYYVTDSKLMSKLLKFYPQTFVDVVNKEEVSLLDQHSYNCKRFAILLEYGAKPIISEKTTLHQCGSEDDKLKKNCPVVNYLQKMIVIDLAHVKRILPGLLKIDLETFSKLENPLEAEFKKEKDVLGNIKINEDMNMLSYILCTPNEAAQYHDNEILQEHYIKYNKDFKNGFKNYGFALNRQFRRAKGRQ